MPPLVIFCVAVAAPLNAFMLLRYKYFSGTLFSILAYAALIIFKNDPLYLVALPLFVIGTSGCYLCVKIKKLYKGLAVMLIAAALSAAAPIFALTVVKKQTLPDFAAAYVTDSSDSTFVVNAAKNSIYKRQLDTLVQITPPQQLEAAKRDLALQIDSTPTEQLLDEFSHTVHDYTQKNMLFYIFTSASLFTFFGYLIVTQLIDFTHQGGKILKQQSFKLTNYKNYGLMPIRLWKLPHAYAFSVLSLYILLYILKYYIPTAEIVYESTYYAVMLIPFALGGISLICYVFEFFKLREVYGVLLGLIISVAFLPVLSIIGMADKMLNTRKILARYKQ